MAAAKQDKTQNFGSQDRFWIPRFWDGMGPSAWFPLLVSNRFAVAPRRVAMAVLISGLSLVNAFLWAVQNLLFGRRIARTQIPDEPIFVLGHWRSGTTLLHELLVLDARHTYADTYDCFAPSHFLVSGWLFRPCLRILLPSKRPVDNMAAGWDHPQEDEFALCNLGVPSPYLTIAFANRPPQCQEFLDMRDVPPAAIEHWKATFLWFLKCLTLRKSKRMVLKSPPHTARVKTLLEMFPKAKFVHIVRDPYSLFPSTVNLWKRLYRDQGLQVPNCEGLDEHVFTTLSRMYDAFERDRQLLQPGQFSEVRYEDLVADPVEQMRVIYEQLNLGGFDQVRPAIERYFAKEKDYKTNRYDMTPELHAAITRRWSKYIERYGYSTAVKPAPAEASSPKNGPKNMPARRLVG